MSAKRERKPLTPEQREAKNKRDRESKRLRLASKAKPAPKPAPVVKVKTPGKKLSAKRPARAKPVVVKLTGGKVVKAPAAPKIIQNGIARPRSCYGDGRPKTSIRVWQIADEISARKAKNAQRRDPKAKGEPATRQEVMDACLREKITYAVFSNQFYRWRKFNGLAGRVLLNGTVAAVTGGPKRGAQAVPKAKKPKLPK